ncbi:MAG TPA: hypothetical protein P5186_27255 [Candidatus Paceibacterota bacterium]|nr:hypothetical protein [Verrucomicrobiota bacterium]HRY51754.1 hypothetical protein [Candidatus Paceibacterota bacterium]HSA02375.1 hypothetical protein [Candidatus Paceibacterota bacterium]
MKMSGAKPDEHIPADRVGLYHRGTRGMENLSELEVFSRPPWTSGGLNRQF